MSQGYHPPKIITNNAAPSISADLAYEAHGKCGATRILRSDWDESEDANIFDAVAEDSRNAWKMVILNVGGSGFLSRCDCNLMGMIREIRMDNVSVADCAKFAALPIYGESMPFEIMGDIRYVELDPTYKHMIAILYIDCDQS
jgi:hypothetical protein